jgi:hypothetical protein
MATRVVTIHDRCTEPGCGRVLRFVNEAIRGTCGSCEIKQWSPEKKKAMNRLFASAFNGSSDEEKAKAVDEAFQHFKEE